MAGTQSTPPQVQQGETPSPLCNYLLEQVKLRLDGGIGAADLKKSAQDALQSLDQAREQTLANLERDGAKDHVLEAFEKSFDDMQAALEEIERYAGDANAETHEAVRQTIFRAAAATATAVVVMQQAQFSEGPTDMPLFNGLFRMKESYLEGKVEGKQLQAALVNIVNMTKAAIAELLAGEGEQPPQRDGLVRAYEEQIESLERVGETIDAGSKDKAQVDDAFEQLLRTSNAVKEAMANLNEALMSKGPCRLARTNVLLSASEAFRSGGIGPEQFGRTLDGFESELKEEQASINELAGMPGHSEAVSDEIAKLREAYDMHDEAISMFSEFLDGEADSDDFTKAQKLLIEASEKLSDVKEELERLSESEGKVSCIRCGKPNEQGSRVCSSCGAQLPQQVGMGVASTMSFQEDDGSAALQEGDLVITANLERLFNAINEIAEERCSDAEFERVLDWMDGLMETAINTMPEIPDMAPPAGTDEETLDQIETLKSELADQRNTAIEGMTTIRDALAHMQSFLDGRDKDVLIQGVRQVRDGAVKMQNAEKALVIITSAMQKTASMAAAARGESVDGDESAETAQDDE
jgi:tetratricopeptide (TPR) repeat protein